jgi:hypothetical protein
VGDRAGGDLDMALVGAGASLGSVRRIMSTDTVLGAARVSIATPWMRRRSMTSGLADEIQ